MARGVASPVIPVLISEAEFSGILLLVSSKMPSISDSKLEAVSRRLIMCAEIALISMLICWIGKLVKILIMS